MLLIKQLGELQLKLQWSFQGAKAAKCENKMTTKPKPIKPNQPQSEGQQDGLCESLHPLTQPKYVNQCPFTTNEILRALNSLKYVQLKDYLWVFVWLEKFSILI